MSADDADTDAPDSAAETDGADAETSSDGDPGPRERVAAALAPVDTALRRIDWWPIVKKEFADTIRSRALIIYAVVLLSLFVLPIAIGLYTDIGGAVQGLSALLLSGQLWLLSVVVPLAAIAFGYAAISGERERGSIKLLLSQPYDRRDVVLGKLVGRFLAVAVPLVGVFAVQLVSVLPSSQELPGLENYAILVALSCLLALVFVGLAVGASAATRTRRRSLAVTGGLWAYMFLLWNSVANGLPTLLNDTIGLSEVTRSELLLVVKLLSPAQAFQSLFRSLTEFTAVEARATMVGNVFLQGRQQAGLRRGMILEQLGESVPWYLTDAAAVVMLALWLVVPIAIGYAAFRAADL